MLACIEIHGRWMFILHTMDGEIYEFSVFYASNTSNLRVDTWQEFANCLIVHGFRMHVCGDFNDTLKFGDSSWRFILCEIWCMKHCLWLTYGSKYIPMWLTKISIITHPRLSDHPPIWIRSQYTCGWLKNPSLCEKRLFKVNKDKLSQRWDI